MHYQVLLFTFVGFTAVAFADEVYEFKGKVALVTGAGQGIGFACCNEILKNGAKGVTIVDINPIIGKRAAMKLNAVYGHGRAIFIPADVSNSKQLEDAFRVTIDHWKRLDIVVNNAAVINEGNWRLPINVNVIGTLQGTLLGFKYMSSSKGGRGGVILNMASVAPIDVLAFVPVYTATKNFVIGLSRSLGHEIYYEYNNVRVVTLCPSWTMTDLADLEKSLLVVSDLSPKAKQLARSVLTTSTRQSTENVGQACAKVIMEGSNGSVWAVEDDQPPYELIFPDRKAMRKSVH